MLQAINTKILLAILAAVAVIGSLVAYQETTTKQAAEASTRAAKAVEQEQQTRQKQEQMDRDFTAKVNERKKKQNNNATDTHKTWSTYVP